ncbi:ABC transporter permease [Thermovenabulum sp.]|uniref:ABC transporter permease n=1 Tax=Thermovenabulum sp. TaxID=3100335 RepID=UPI003C7CE47F
MNIMADKGAGDLKSEIMVEKKENKDAKRWQETNIFTNLVAILTPLILLLLWEFMAGRHFIDVRLFSSPSRIFKTLVPLILSGELIYHTLVSVERILLGFLVGSVPAVILGIIMGLIPTVRAALMPLISIMFPIPKLAVMPLILIVFGLGEASKIFTIAIGVFFLVLINTMAGVMSIDPIYIDVAKSFGAKPLQIYRTVAIPGALPMIFAGFKLGMGTALLLIVAAELSAARAGVGWMIWRAYDMFDIERMFCALLMLAFLGYVFAYALEFLEKIAIPWKHR